MELTTQQVVILGLVAPVLVQIIKLLGAWFKKDLSQKTIIIILFVVSIVMAFIFMLPQIPAWDFESIMSFIFVQMGAVMGLASLIYLFLYKWVFDKLTLNKERFLAKG